MELQAGSYRLQFENGGVAVEKDGETLYFNHRPLYAFIKTSLSITEFYDKAYEDVRQAGSAVLAGGVLATPAGSRLRFEDRYEEKDGGLKISRSVVVEKAVDDLGFATKISFVLAASDKVGDYDCFAPGAWYGRNQFAPQEYLGADDACEYFWRRELRYGLPMFAAQNRGNGETVCLSRWAADVTMCDTSIVRSEHHVDSKTNMGGIGLSRPEAKTLNYLYYGFPLRKDIATEREGLSIDYVFPGADGELPRQGKLYNVDYMMRTKTLSRVYHPMEQGFEQSYAIAVDFACYDGYYPMMRESWRRVYSRLRDKLYPVDQEKHFHNCMTLLEKLTRQYGDSWGLPFSAQLPDMDVSSVSFQFGFVGQQPGIAYQLLRYGDKENVPAAYEKGQAMLDFWVRAAATESGAPNVCYNPVLEGFEPYPHWTRMIADGLEAILDAWAYLRHKGQDKTSWYDFCVKAGEWLVGIQNPDGSFYRAYNLDGSMRMDSKANTTSVVRFLVQLYWVSGNEAYREAALKAGQWCYKHVYGEMEYRGSTCDNMDIMDNESGIYAMFAFLALYDLTGEQQWLEALRAAADFTETWTYAWSYPIRTLLPKHPFNHASISGQSFITITGDGVDVYMAACAYTYYRLYLITGDKHYCDFAEFIHNNTRQSNDVDGSAGYSMPGLGHESSSLLTQTLQGHYHWLPWCTFVEVDPASRLKDSFGSYDIAGAEKLPEEEKQARNHIDGYYRKAARV